MTRQYDIRRAVETDVVGILELQEPNLPENGGTLAVRFSRDWFLSAVADMPVIVGLERGKVVGYLVSASRPAYAGIPIVQATLRVYPGGADSYFYGPICVDERHRGRRLAAAMFAELCTHLPGREGIFYLPRDGTASINAHRHMGIKPVAEFTHNGAKCDVYAYVG